MRWDRVLLGAAAGKSRQSSAQIRASSFQTNRRDHSRRRLEVDHLEVARGEAVGSGLGLVVAADEDRVPDR